MEDHSYTFSAIRGIQAGREYYIIMCPFRLLSKIFLFNEEEIPAQLRAQRVLNKARVPEIAGYIIKNPKDYCFSAITASVNGDVKFSPLSDDEFGKNVGRLVIGMSSIFVINDGQHRRAAIEEALKLKPEFGNEKICVVLFIDRGLKRSQQMFADLNKFAVRPSGSLGVLYDQHDPLAELTRLIIDKVPVFENMIELEKTSISNRSKKLFTLNGLYLANKSLLFKNKRQNIKISSTEEQTAIDFWTNVSKSIDQWQMVKEGEMNPSDFRKEYICAHGVALQALGHVGGGLLVNYSNVWKDKIKLLRSLNWKRNNSKLWEGRASVGGRMTSSPANILLTSAAIKKHISIQLTPEETSLEKSVHK